MVSTDHSTITCNSTHLTSFAVLVDVSGGHRVSCVTLWGFHCSSFGYAVGIHLMLLVLQDISEAESKALSIVSYIGCGISMLCLVIAIIVLAFYRLVI